MLAGAGGPLDPSIRSFMEHGLGHDLGHVRIHAGPQAALAARSLGALAFTSGRDVVLGAGAPVLASPRGQELLAHELTHVLQAGTGPADTTLRRTENPSAVVEPTDLDTPTDLETQAAELAELGIAIATSVGWYAAYTLRDILAGDFVEDPTALAIVVRTLLTLIPYVDTAADIEDLVANIVYCLLDPAEKLTSLGWWFTIVLSLIGLFPEFGSVIKGVAKLVVKGIGSFGRSGIDALLQLLGSGPHVVDDAIAGISELLATAAAWRPWVLTTFLDIVQTLLDHLSRVPAAAAAAVAGVLAVLRQLRDSAGEWVTKGCDEVDRLLRLAMSALTGRPPTTGPPRLDDVTEEITREARRPRPGAHPKARRGRGRRGHGRNHEGTARRGHRRTHRRDHQGSARRHHRGNHPRIHRALR